MTLASDWGVWAGVGVSLAGTGWAIVTSLRAGRTARQALVESRRQSAAQERLASAAAPRPLVLERVSASVFVLRNIGPTRIVMRIERPSVPHRDLPEHAELAPGEGLRFMMFESLQGGLLPTHLTVHVEGFSEPMLVPVPA